MSYGSHNQKREAETQPHNRHDVGGWRLKRDLAHLLVSRKLT